MVKRRRRVPAWATGALLCALFAAAPDAARGESAEWKELRKAFEETWQIGPVDSVEHLDEFIRESMKRSPRPLDEPLALDGLDKLRASKRAAAKGIGGAGDWRGVTLLMKAHADQLKFIGKQTKLYETYLGPWKKRQPQMEKSILAKQEAALRANPGVDPKEVKYNVTAAEGFWQRQGQMLERIWKEILEEEEIAEYTRKSIARLVNGLEGGEWEKGFGCILKAAGKGTDPEQLEFVRLIGYVAGDTARQTLEKYAASMQPFVVQAALEALGRQNDPKSIDTLLGRLDDPRWQVRASSLVGLSFYQDVRVVEALLERVQKEDGVMRRHYFSALNKMVGTAVIGSAVAWTKWWKEHKAKVIEAWKTGGRVGPVEDDPASVGVKSEGGGHTSFYGLKTESIHIIFVLDISGSMGEYSGKDENGKFRIDIAKAELKKAIATLSDKDSDARGVASFNIVVYAADVQVYKEGKMIPASRRNKEKASKWIDSLEAIGATNIYDALEQAFQIIDTRKAKKQLEKGADTIFLMTDGKPNRGKITDPELIRQEIAKMNRDRRITINAIGVGEDHEAEFLKKLAAENHGEYLAR